jgi:thiamine biosynthesis lipoprotein
MPTVTQSVFPAMGNTADVTVVGGDHLIEFASFRLQQLEHLWSRFISTSEISQLNNAAGKATTVSPHTIQLVKYLVGAYESTNGAFDPTLLPVLINIGYGTSLSHPERQSILHNESSWTIPLSEIRIDEEKQQVQLPAGLTLDPGGLGKGLAADMLATELIDRGASGACVSVGGDIRCIGQSPQGDFWTIPIETPSTTNTLNTVSFRQGGIATSWIDAKTWETPAGVQHHILNPKTKLPLTRADSSLVQTTVIANEAVWAEIYATALLVSGAEIMFPIIDNLGVAAQVIEHSGKVLVSKHWKEFSL